MSADPFEAVSRADARADPAAAPGSSADTGKSKSRLFVRRTIYPRNREDHHDRKTPTQIPKSPDFHRGLRIRRSDFRSSHKA
jgi:hypothetical protein